MTPVFWMSGARARMAARWRRHRGPVVAPSIAADAVFRRAGEQRRDSTPAGPRRVATPLVNVIRPENKITSNYGFLGNTLAVRGDAPRRPYICTHCFCTCQEIVLHPRQGNCGGGGAASELLTKAILERERTDENASRRLERHAGISDTVPARLFPGAKPVAWLAARRRPRRHVPRNPTSVSIRANYGNIPPRNT